MGCDCSKITVSAAPWSFVDSGGTVHEGTGNTLVEGVRTGGVEVTWLSAPGYLQPVPAITDGNLAKDDILAFSATYLEFLPPDDCPECVPDTKTHYDVGEDACLHAPGTFPPGILYQWYKAGSPSLVEGRIQGLNCQTLFSNIKG